MKNEKKYKGVYLDAKTGKYYVSTTFRSKDGAYIKKCKRGFETAKKAEIWKQQTMAEYSEMSAETLGIAKAEMEQLFEDYMKKKKMKLKPLTYRAFHYAIQEYVISFIKDKKAKDLSIKDLNNIYNALAEKDIKNSSKNIIVARILDFIDYLDLNEAIDSSLYRKTKILFERFNDEIDKKDFVPFEKEEVKAILEASKEAPIYHLLYSILAFTGCRIGEALGLQFKDLEGNKIHFYKQVQDINDDNVDKKINAIKLDKTSQYIFFFTKTNQTKKVSISQELIAEILEYQKNNGFTEEDYIFSFNKGILQKSKIRRDFKNLQLSLGIEPRKIHAFRHFHTSQLYEANLDPKYIAERLGHVDETMSMKVYNHLSKEKLNKQEEIASKLII